MGVLTLRYQPDDQWLGQLVVSVSVGGFSGVGTAWFSLDNLRDFAEAITAFPLPIDTPPTISGGFGGDEKNIAQEHVVMTFEQHNARGEVRATVRLATEVWKDPESDLAKEMTVRFLVNYSDLGQFGPAMLDAIEGRVDEAVLTCSP